MSVVLDRWHTYDELMVAAYSEVDVEALERSDAERLVLADLDLNLRRTMERLGRVPVGEIEVTTNPRLNRNVVIYRAAVRSTVSTEGEWPSVWAAVREDGWL